jgi:hypothetical protein
MRENKQLQGIVTAANVSPRCKVQDVANPLMLVLVEVILLVA